MVDVPKKANAFEGKVRRKLNLKGAQASTRVIPNVPPLPAIQDYGADEISRLKRKGKSKARYNSRLWCGRNLRSSNMQPTPANRIGTILQMATGAIVRIRVGPILMLDIVADLCIINQYSAKSMIRLEGLSPVRPVCLIGLCRQNGDEFAAICGEHGQTLPKDWWARRGGHGERRRRCRAFARAGHRA